MWASNDAGGLAVPRSVFVGNRSELTRGEVYMSAEVLDQVWTAEMAFLRDMYLLDADFFRFVWNLLQQPEAESPRTAILAVHAGTKVGWGLSKSPSYFIWAFKTLRGRGKELFHKAEEKRKGVRCKKAFTRSRR